MNQTILKSFISNLNFVTNRRPNSYSDNLEISILYIDNECKKINGTILIKNDSKDNETITFNIQLNEIDNILIIKSNYKSDKSPEVDNEITEVNTFVIGNPETKSFYTPKIKYLIHLVDGNIKQAYIVNKKYKFSNGISENYSKLNMDNKDNINNVNNIYTSHAQRR